MLAPPVSGSAATTWSSRWGWRRFEGESWLLAASDLGATGRMGLYGRPGGDWASVGDDAWGRMIGFMDRHR